MATAERARNEVLGLLDRLKQDSDALAKALHAFVAEADPPEAEESGRGARLTDQEAFLNMKESLLAEHRGKYVAFANGQLVAVGRSWAELLPSLQAIDPAVDVYVERVEEEAFLDAPEFDCPEVYEIADASERPS